MKWVMVFRVVGQWGPIDLIIVEAIANVLGNLPELYGKILSEDIIYLSHGTWRYQADTDLEPPILLANFHHAGMCLKGTGREKE